MRVINANNRFNVYKGATLVYTGNSLFMAALYKIAEQVNKDYYVGDTRKYGG